MAASCCILPCSYRFPNAFITGYVYFLLLLHFGSSLYFQVPRFDPGTKDILYIGDAVPTFGAVNFNSVQFCCRIGQVLYKRKVPIWDSRSRKVSDFVTHFSFIIDTLGASTYGHGLAFFLAPVGFTIPLNSAAGFLGLFNSSDSSQNQPIVVEFDSFPNPEWDPPFEHVGINKNSISSANYVAWNASLHSGETADTWISYNATTKNLSVFWTYEGKQNFRGNSSLSYQIYLEEVLPPWATIGFSVSTGQFMERNILKFWEFNSSLDITEGQEETSKRVRLAVGLTVPLGVLLAGGIVAYVIWSRKRKRLTEESLETMNLSTINDDIKIEAGPKRFSYSDLALATNNFIDDRKLGEGGFGCVYRGYLIREEVAVAVKKISRGSKQGKKEYLAEVNIISRLRHRNLVQLIGWCHDQNQFLLVYELMPNGSLDSHLFGKKAPLVWAMRYKTALGLASALLYLHEEWEQCVVHRDIKSSNIMLDSGFNVKLGDFGLARLMDHELGPLTTGIAGTLGYMAPEYISTGKASKESDVYSFGVVVLEIASGRRAIDCVDGNSSIGLVDWVRDLYARGELVLAVDERLNNDFDAKQFDCLMMVGLWCAHRKRSLRPSIRQAIQVLTFETAIPDLPVDMPVLAYNTPTIASCSGDAMITSTSINIGR